MANFYWVGGTAAWTATNFATVWRLGSLTGTTPAAAPTLNDSVYFTAPGPYTVTINISVSCLGFFNSHTSGTVTFAGTGSISTQSGELNTGSNAPSVWTFSGTISLFGSTQPNGIRVYQGPYCSGLPNANIQHNTSGTGIGSTIPSITCNTITINSGYVIFNAGATVNCNSFSVSSSFANTLEFNGATINLTGSGTVLSATNLSTATIVDSLGYSKFVATMNTAKTFTWGTTGGSSVKAVNLQLNSGVSIPTFTTNSWFKTLSFSTGVTSTPPAATVNVNSLGLNSTIIHSNISWIFRGTGTLTTNNNTNWSANTVINTPGGAVTLQDAWAHDNGTITLTAGTLNTNGFNVTSKALISNNSNVRAINMTGASAAWTLTNSTLGNVTLWDISGTNMTRTMDSSWIYMSSNGGTNLTFNGNGLAYRIILFDTNKNYIFTGANTYTILNNQVGYAPLTVTFPAGVTSTFGSFELVGRAANLVTIQSSTSGTAAILYKPSGTAASDYLSIKDIKVTGATWYPGTNTTLVSGNTGWYGTTTPMTNSKGNMLAMFVP